MAPAEVLVVSTPEMPAEGARRFRSFRRLPGVANVKAGLINSHNRVSRMAQHGEAFANLPSRMKSLSKIRPSRWQRRQAEQARPTKQRIFETDSSSSAPDLDGIGDEPPVKRRRTKGLKPAAFLRPLTVFSIRPAVSVTSDRPPTPFVLVTPTVDAYGLDDLATPFNRNSFIIISKDDALFEEDIPLYDTVSQNMRTPRRIMPPSLTRIWRKTTIIRPFVDHRRKSAASRTANVPSDEVCGSHPQGDTLPPDHPEACLRVAAPPSFNQPIQTIRRGREPLHPVLPVPLSEWRTEQHVPAAWRYETQSEDHSNRLTGAFLEDLEDGYDTESVYSSD
ncbi:hypothetical protein HGRIS_010707 [Hohenbuehelia grisea]